MMIFFLFSGFFIIMLSFFYFKAISITLLLHLEIIVLLLHFFCFFIFLEGGIVLLSISFLNFAVLSAALGLTLITTFSRSSDTKEFIMMSSLWS